MGIVYVADSLRGTYRADHWLIKSKWWWSLLFQTFGVMLYKRLSQYEPRIEIALHWINTVPMKEEKKTNN